MTVENITSDIEILPAQRPAQADAIGQLMAHAQAMTTAKQLADALCDTDLVPAIYKGKPGNGAAAILYGAEIGLNPIQSLQQIFVVHGAPAIYARTAVALVKRHGITVQTVSSTDDSVTVSACNPKTGEVEVATWDIKRAELAGFTTNKQYKTNPQSMLYAKAAMEVCRKIAPDVLLGIAYSREELELESPFAPRKVASTRRGVDGLRAAIAPAVEPEIVGEEEEEEDDEQPAAAQGMPAATRKKWEKSLATALAEADCTDFADCEVVIGELVGRATPISAEGLFDDELRQAVGKLDAARKDGTLGGLVTEILNIAALRSELA